MCAIVGAVGASGTDEAGERLVRRMAARLAHRGPDGEGFFRDGAGPGAGVHLGHRRLGIFDPGPGGAQPMTDGTGRYTAVFNGAIYNFLEIAEELRQRPGSRPLRGGSDTEVLLEAWAAFGPECLPRLNGMFAFALWDAAARTLHLCRDRFGVKPLFYAYLGEAPGGMLGGTIDGTRLLFASEVKALFCHPALRPVVDLRRLAEFLATQSVDHTPEETLFRGVLQVPPACRLELRPEGAPRISRYWRLVAPPPRERLPLTAALLEQGRDLLRSAVALRLRSDVPVGGTLSGGLDSSVLCGLVAGPLHREGRVRTPYRIFTSQFPGLTDEGEEDRDESPWAEAVLSSLPGEAVRPVRSRPDVRLLLEDLPAVLYHQEEPFSDSSIGAHYALMRRVREEGVKVVLTGQGADEVFAGYLSYYNVYLAELLRGGHPLRAAREALVRQRRLRPGLRGLPLLGRSLLGGLYHGLPADLREPLYWQRQRGFPLGPEGVALLAQASPRYLLDAGHGTAADSGFSVLDRYLIDCIERWALPHILRQDDRNAMAFGVESRAPYLDHRLVEFLFRTAPEVRLGDGWNKRLLRELGRGLVPEAVRLRLDKMGFFSPRCGLLRLAQGWVQEVAGELPEALRPLVDRQGWRGLLRRFYREGDISAAAPVWAGFICSLWLRSTVPALG